MNDSFLPLHYWRPYLGVLALFFLLAGGVYLTLTTNYADVQETPVENAFVLKQAPLSTEGWKVYKNTQYKYELLYPNDWRCRTAVGQSGTVFCATSTPNVVFEPKNTLLTGGLNGVEVSVLNTTFENMLVALQTDAYRKTPISDAFLGGIVGKKASIKGITTTDYEVVIVPLDERQTVRFTYHTNATTDAILGSFKFIK